MKSGDHSINASLSLLSRLNVADFLVFTRVRRLRDIIVTVWQRCKIDRAEAGGVFVSLLPSLISPSFAVAGAAAAKTPKFPICSSPLGFVNTYVQRITVIAVYSGI